MNKKVVAAVVLLTVPMLAIANVVPNDEVSDSSRVYDIDEIVVVSQPKELFKLRQQSLSSSLYTGKEMNALGVRDLRELSSYVPSFVMPNYGSRLTSSIYVRGIGSRVNSPAVGIYEDGIPLMSKSAFNSHLYQIDRIDVLRGPQGTLYGQNSEGGLVKMYSVNPFRYQGTDINLGWGTHFYRNAEISHSHRFSDKLALSIAGFYDGQNGFFKNMTTLDRADQYNEAGGKFRLMYRPAERWNIDLLADYQYVRQNAFPYGLMDAVTGETASPSTNRQSNYRRNMLVTGLNIGYRADSYIFNSITSYQYLKDYMLMDQDYLPQDFMHLEQRQFQNAFTQEFTFRSNRPVAGFWHWTAGAFLMEQWLKTWAPVYFDSAVTTPIANAIQTQMYNAMLNAMAARMVAKGMPLAAAQQAAAAAIEKAGGVSMSVDMMVPGVFRTPQYNLGFFHESNFDITDRLTATLGFRYDYTHTSIDYQTSAAMSLTANVMGQQATYVLSSVLNNNSHHNFNQLLPKFGLNYRFDRDGSNVYATVSKGYRAGGFNIQMFSDVLRTELNANQAKAMRGSYDVPHTEADYENISKTISYKPETSWNYEVGTHLNLFQNQVHFDLSAFYMEVRNQQLSVMAGNYGYGRMMVNAGKSYSCGIEASLRGSAFDNHLDWTLSYGLTHAAFKDYTDSVRVNGSYQMVSYKDNKVPYVPMHTLAARVDYRLDLLSSLLKSVTLGANMNGQGKTYWDEANTCSQKFYVIAGAHVNFDFGAVSLDVWGRNLFDTRANTFAVNSAATGTQYWFAQRVNPVQFGANVKLHF
jgi:iron complex outermembrane receptor protein